MNKNVIIGLVVVVVAALGYYQFSYKPAQDAAVAVKAAEEQAAAEAKAAEEAAAKVAADAQAAADAAAAKVADEAKAAADAAAKAVTDTATAATDAATAVVDSATTAVTDAANSAMAGLDDLLKPENFDLAKVTAAIDASAIDDAMKATLKSAVDAAKDSPALLGAVLERVKAALTTP